MHWEAFTFVQAIRSQAPHFFCGSRVVEFGSVRVNYSISELFEQPAKYIGVDLIDGPGVDVVSDAKDVFLGNDFDVAVSCECFEHNPYFLKTFENMCAHVKPGGLVLFTCATTGRPWRTRSNNALQP